MISLHEFEQVFRSLGRERCLYLRNGRNIVEQTAILFPNILYFDRLSFFENNSEEPFLYIK